ncbi:acyltransferase [Ochrovirga pacifica]|uniref:acyltransferase n=1 Tax=Ochrovirga pacifica TaxID=1042376 RepID=UPI0002559DFE|nr:acyltransferase [Ochrovirga pacifica]
MISTLYKAFRKVKGMLFMPFYNIYAKVIFFLNDVNYGKDLKVLGVMKVRVTRRGKVTIGDNFCANSGENFNVIGRQQKTIFWVEGELSIGDNVGMSSTALICNHKITIGNDVKLGGGVCVYDTDFHNLDPEIRRDPTLDKKTSGKAEVNIGDNAFLGAHTTILKGVTIGENSVVGACSLVSKSIPANQIWAGNPAKFIKEL